MQLILAFAVLGSLLIVGGLLVRPTPPSRLRGVRSGDGVTLRPPRGRYAILGAMALGPTVLVVVVALTAARRAGMGPAGLAVVALAVGLGLAIAGYFFAAEGRMRVRVDARGVERIDPFRRRQVAWGEVRKIAYNGVSRWFFLTGPGDLKLWIPESMAGIGDFAEAAMAGIPPAVVRADAATHEALEQLVAEAKAEDRAGADGARR